MMKIKVFKKLQLLLQQKMLRRSRRKPRRRKRPNRPVLALSNSSLEKGFHLLKLQRENLVQRLKKLMAAMT